jgi:hypothetical protein
MTEQQGSFRLRVEPCRREPTRYSWMVLDHEQVVRQSCYSLPSKQMARRRGQAELKDVEALWRDSR